MCPVDSESEITPNRNGLVHNANVTIVPTVGASRSTTLNPDTRWALFAKENVVMPVLGSFGTPPKVRHCRIEIFSIQKLKNYRLSVNRSFFLRRFCT